jgi:predicted Rossmann-fold nucleotide-binding protein
MSKIIIGVMGPGENATPEENELAYDLGKAIASEGWITLTGGRSFGVMDASL